MRITQIQPDAMTMAGRHTLVEINMPQILYKVQGTSSTAPDFTVAINSGATQASNTTASGTFSSKMVFSLPPDAYLGKTLRCNGVDACTLQPTIARDSRSLRFTLADSSSGDILRAAGGSIRRNGVVVDIPPRASMAVQDAEKWLASTEAKIEKFIDPKASKMEQAYQWSQMSDAMGIASRNAMVDANAATRLNFVSPPQTFAQFKAKWGQEAGGNALWDKIIVEAKRQLREPGCSVAGTLVHTKEGLRPIEQIKVGDYVLAKPEDGSGVASYKRVTQTYQHGEREVYLMTWQTRQRGENKEIDSYAVVTGGHPIWVGQILDDDDQLVESINGWLDVHTLWKRTIVDRIAIKKPPYNVEGHLLDRTPAILFIEPILATKNDEVGITFFDSGFGHVGYGFGSLEGTAVQFSNGKPEVAFIPYSYGMGTVKIYMDVEPLEDYEDYDPDSIEFRSFGYRQLRKPVFNIEVEDDHTYFVGDDGLWVHNTSGPVLDSVGPSPAQPIGIFIGD